MTISPNQLRDKRVELILQQLEELPTLPAVALRVLEVVGNESSSVAEVVGLISSDPSLTAKILKLVRSASVAAKGEAATIERAVVMLGFQAVRSAALAVSVFQTFAHSGQDGAHFHRDEFWKHSLAVACCAELLAEQLAAKASRPAEAVIPPEAFVCGLLHDLGKIALDTILPKSFDRVVEAADLLRGNIADLEHNVIGLDHMIVGKRLAERWQFPLAIRDCIWLHGQDPAALPSTVKDARLVNLVTLADLLVRQQHLGYSGNYTFPVARQSLMNCLHLSEPQVAAALGQLLPHVERRAAILGLGRTSSNELYQQALAQANKELGRLSEQLATKNRKLTVRARFFDALSEFHSELSPDAPPQIVLRAIGQTAVGILSAGCLAVFSLLPGQTFAEVVLFDEQGEMISSNFVDCPHRPASPAEEGPVLSAGDDMEWLVSVVSPRLSHDQRFWICLESDGQCIGGVVWGAPRGEAQQLGSQLNELSAIACGWGLALRTAQIRQESHALAEQLADANRRLHSVQCEILHSKTMASVGELAAGAAHEMNNPLAVISGRSQLLAGQLTDSRHQHAAKLIYEQAQRLSQIISDLMDFAKPVPPHPEPVAFSQLMNNALQQAKQGFDPADRTIELTAENAPAVLVDPGQTTDALAQVLLNALQATDPATGRVSIRASVDPTADRLVVTVADNGCGMDEVTLKHAFDPFFSSMPAGRRRGMGLAKALRWAESSGGSLRLESQAKQGTRAILLLPLASRSAGGAP